MSFGEISLVTGADLLGLVTELRWIAERDRLVSLRIAIDAGSVKIKVNEGVWTRPYGGLDPQCLSASPRRRDPRPCYGISSVHPHPLGSRSDDCPECDDPE